MNQLQLMTGVDIPIKELGTSIHQPTIKEISMIGEMEYFSTMQLFCFDKSSIIAANPKGASNLLNMNNFEIFMTLIEGPEVEQRKNDILSVLAIYFPTYTVQFLPRGLYFNSVSEQHNFTLDERNFDSLRNVLHEVSGLKNASGGQDSSFNPKNKQAAEIAAKLMRGRARVAAQRNQGKQGGILSRYVSIIAVGLQLNVQDCLNYTVYQVYDIIERYRLWIGWDIDIKSRLAGGTPDSKPEDWMQDLH